MSGMANSLEEAGFLSRRRYEGDGRPIHLHLTSNRHAAYRLAKRELKTLNTLLTEDFSEGEIRTVAG
ncbi:DNA-binding MarR family transcriptional regulator [Xanthomonas arboricola]|nr:DNA-binding MarR family transcriptional regulator [Xanthomonas cannabis]